MKIQINGLDELSQAITTLGQYIRKPRKTFALAAVMMHTDVMDHFKQEMGDDGKWARFLNRKGRRVSRRPTKRGGTKLLQDTGDLRGSLTRVYSWSGAEVGTNKIYAQTHQMGDRSRNIVDRPFAWLSEKMRMRIADQFIFDMDEATK
jgi:phage gpG-like protein